MVREIGGQIWRPSSPSWGRLVIVSCKVDVACLDIGHDVAGGEEETE